MKSSQNYLKTHEILPNISFKDGQAHKVKLIEDKLDSITGQNGELVEGVAFKVIENGQVKRFFTSSQGLISKLSEILENTTVSIQMKRRNTDQGIRSYFEVKRMESPETEETSVSPEPTAPGEIPDSEIPIIEENEEQPDISPETQSETKIPF